MCKTCCHRTFKKLKKIMLFITIFVSIQLICLASRPAIAESPSCKPGEGAQWKLAQLPPDLEKDYLGKKRTTMKTVITTRGSVGYLVRHDFDAGQHVADADILVKTKQGWHSVFEHDVSISKIPLVVLNTSNHGFYNLCNPYPCCGAKPVEYRFNGLFYDLVK